MILEQRGIKARYVIVGKRGGKPIEAIPKPKHVIEFNGWVLREKIKAGFGIAILLIIGFIIAHISWQALLAACIIGFLAGFFSGGDIETGP